MLNLDIRRRAVINDAAHCRVHARAVSVLCRAVRRAAGRRFALPCFAPLVLRNKRVHTMHDQFHFADGLKDRF